ncbi:hypothetical protein DXG01_015956, partial [Tephrocybe rancida]
MCELNQTTGKWVIPTDRLSSKVIRTHFVDKKRYHDLILINLITHRGQVNPRVFEQIMAAWRASAEEAVRKDNYYQNLCDEREDAIISESEEDYNSASDNSEEEPIREPPHRVDRRRSRSPPPPRRSASPPTCNGR